MSSRKLNLLLQPGDRRHEFNEGTLLLDALAEAGVMVKTPCGGRGFCGKCGIKVRGKFSGRTPQEEKLFPGQDDIRLACQLVLTSDVEVFADWAAGAPLRKISMPHIEGEAGIVVDIGTTTIQIAVVDPANGRTFLLDSFLNPQRRFGHDVIARISAAADTDTAGRLVSTLRSSISRSAAAAPGAAGLPPERIGHVCFAGNTTMLYFLFGLDVKPLGVFPFSADHLDFSGVSCADIEFGAFPAADIYALPAASAYLGGDLVGGCALTHEMGCREHVFFIDLGTNGEIFLRNGDGEIYAASCAMGPALEGMNISSGMTADDGAIAHINNNDGELLFEVIGGVPPRGICGTGIVDAIALLLREGVVKPDGGFNAGASSASELFPDGIVLRGGIKSVTLTEDVALSQKDIRSIQLAKGASLSASRILLRKSGCKPEEIRHVFIAGAFGENLNIENFRLLKFIPDFPNAEYRFLGNSSLAAAGRACCSREFRDLARNLRDSLHVIELSGHPDFNDEFVQCLDF